MDGCNCPARALRSVRVVRIARSSALRRLVKSNLLILYARNQRAAFVRVHHQRQQARFRLQRSHNLQQARMKHESIVVGINANRNSAGHKQRPLDRIDQLLRPAQLQNAAAVSPARLFLSGRQRSPGVRNQRRACCRLAVPPW